LLASQLILAISFYLPLVTSSMIVEAMGIKILLSVFMIFPLGFCLGCFFPVGMHLVAPAHSGKTPWYWALNGIFGVLCSALAVLISIYAGISFNFYLAAIFYALLFPVVRKLAANFS
jgi:hypothetical protein